MGMVYLGSAIWGTLCVLFRFQQCGGVVAHGFAMAETREQFISMKNDVLNKEKSMRTGGDLILNQDELKVNDLLMRFKRKEFSVAMEKKHTFPPAEHFFKAKANIDKSDVFKLIRKMPKGGILHVHDMAMVDIRWVIQKATYDDNCYMCILASGQLLLHYYDKPPQDAEQKWQRVNDARKKSGDAKKFDDWLYTQLTIIVDDPAKAYPTQDEVWDKFQSIFTALIGLTFYAPFFKDYFYQSMLEFYVDNVQYIEMRGLVPELYELDGSTHNREWTLEAYVEGTKQFIQDHPDYIGTKLITSAMRSANKSEVMDEVKFAIKMREKFPDMVAGFDLVGQEDQGNSLEYYVDELLYPSQLNPPVDLPYFFHAGETTWEGTIVDRNIIDALLLNTSRIGHGFALPKHPQALEMARKKDIPIEVNPISNQVLQLVADLRDHTAATLFATGGPMVVSCDDPVLWGATGVSYDYYEAFMGIAGEDGNLATLKKLFMDSIKYSAMKPAEKQQAMTVWEKKWAIFVSETIQTFSL